MRTSLRSLRSAASRQSELVILGFGRATEALLNIVQVRIYSQLLPVAEVGRLALILAIAGFFMQMFLATAGSFVQRHASEWQAEHRLRQEVINFTYYLVLALPVVALLLSMSHFLLSSISQFSLSLLIVLICGTVFCQGEQQNLTAVLNMLGYRRWFVVMSSTAILAAVICAYLSARHFGATALIWQSGFIVGLGLVVPVLLVLVWRDRPPPPWIAAARPAAGMFSAGALSFMIPLLVSAMCFWVQNFGYRLALGERASVEMVGFFTVGFSLGTLPMLLITKIATDYLLPDFYRNCAHRPVVKCIEAWERFSRQMISVGLIAAPLMAASAVFFCRFLVGPNFWQYAWLAGFGVGFQMLFMVYSTYLYLAQVLHKNKSVIPGNVFSSAALVLGTYLFAKQQPLIGTGLSLVGGAAMLVLMTAWSLHRQHAITLPWRAFGFALLLGMAGWVPISLFDIFLAARSLAACASVLILAGFYFIAALGLFLRRYGE